MNNVFKISEIESEKAVRIAEEDIVCYETFSRPQEFHFMFWEYNEIGDESFEKNDLVEKGQEVHGGYKTFINIASGEVNLKFIIPQGSKYYVNSETGIYVSERIILADTEPYFYIDNSNEEYLKSKDIIATEDDIKDDFQCLVDAGKTKEEVVEIMNKMLNEQYRQGNPKSLEIMGKYFGTNIYNGGFDLGYSVDGYDYWRQIHEDIENSSAVMYHGELENE